jgi:hypothetical protein
MTVASTSLGTWAQTPPTAPAGAVPVPADLPRDGLIAHWAGDGDARDSAGSHQGKVGKGVAFTADRHGKAKGAFPFNGRSGFITVPDRDTLDADEALTLSAWIKPAAYRDQRGHECVILSKYLHHLEKQGDYVLMLRASGEVKLGVIRGEPAYAAADLGSGSSIRRISGRTWRRRSTGAA